MTTAPQGFRVSRVEEAAAPTWAPSAVVCWKWQAPPGYRSTFGPEAVNVLRRMVARHYARPHEFICVTDDPTGIDPEVRIVPLWSECGSVPNPHGNPREYPSCYRRLRAFAADAQDVFGERFVSIDLDTVITGDLVPVWERAEEFVIWRDTNPRNLYNGSMFLMTAGARPQVWDRFDPETSPGVAQRAGCWGSDQGWISYVLGRQAATWKKTDGVYSFRNQILPQGGRLPKDARVVFFHGPIDPWQPETQRRYAWIREHYR